MSDYLLTEQEQIQQLKSWLKQYGPTVIAGIIIAIVVTTGWQYWQNYQNKILSHASIVYDEMLTLRAQNNIANADVQAKKILSHYPKTPYAPMAALMLAFDSIQNKNYKEAENQLNWVIDHSKNPAIREIARIRLARVLIAEQEPAAALEILEKMDDKSFVGLINEVRGDAFLAQKDIANAREHYHLALAEIPNAEVARPVLQMKYDNLAIETNTKIS